MKLEELAFGFLCFLHNFLIMGLEDKLLSFFFFFPGLSRIKDIVFSAVTH